MPPVTPAHWTGVRSASAAGPVCPQTLPDIGNETRALSTMTSGRLNQLKRLLPLLQTQSEDCLYLNIYAPVSGKFSPLHSSDLSLELSAVLLSLPLATLTQRREEGRELFLQKTR